MGSLASPNCCPLDPQVSQYGVVGGQLRAVVWADKGARAFDHEHYAYYVSSDNLMVANGEKRPDNWWCGVLPVRGKKQCGTEGLRLSTSRS